MGKILTIIVPSYNTEKYILKNIPYLLDKDINQYIEILIINDGSIDKTKGVKKNSDE